MIIPIEEDTKEEKKEWRSCCYKLNPSFVKYMTHVSVLGGLIIFSASMLVLDKDCNNQRNYSSLLMVCLGCFLPTPKIDKIK